MNLAALGARKDWLTYVFALKLCIKCGTTGIVGPNYDVLTPHVTKKTMGPLFLCTIFIRPIADSSP